MSKCLMATCGHEVLPGDVLCAEHAAHYRRRECDVDLCQWCGARLVTMFALRRGYCNRCLERTPGERVEVRAKRRVRIERRERMKRLQREQRRSGAAATA